MKYFVYKFTQCKIINIFYFYKRKIVLKDNSKHIITCIFKQIQL